VVRKKKKDYSSLGESLGTITERNKNFSRPAFVSYSVRFVWAVGLEEKIFVFAGKGVLGGSRVGGVEERNRDHPRVGFLVNGGVLWGGRNL